MMASESLAPDRVTLLALRPYNLGVKLGRTCSRRADRWSSNYLKAEVSGTCDRRTKMEPKQPQDQDGQDMC